jgi:hypothetical protein
MLVMLGVWIYQEAIAKFLMKGEESVRHPYLWGARALLLVLLLISLYMVWLAWKKKREKVSA